jgi:hypothetical protein
MSIVTFFCDEQDDPITIFLEPYETSFEVEPGNEMTFEGKYPNRDFKWIIRFGDTPHQITLKAERNDGKINVYDNDVLIEQW